MTPPHAQSVSIGRPPADVAAPGAPQPAGPFVINLCSSTTPMALSQPQDPELKQFTFFVSRRLEDGRERFRLHMGYFETLQEAEEWITVVREFYPGAWAGEAPGKRLRPRAEAAAAPAAVVSAVTAAPATAPAGAAPVIAATLAPAITAAAAPPIAAAAQADVPVLHAAPELASAVPEPSVLELLETPPRYAPMQARVPIDPAAVESEPVKPAAKPHPPALRLSNVREVLASLEETEATREMPAVKAPRAQQPDSARALSDTQVLKLLERRRSDGKRAETDSSISMLKPDDTGTRRALQEAVAGNAPVSFAVQLQWSVQRIDVAKVPPLAIFGAYTLYTVEGSREGRRWYGLRLGFFSDAVSAKQVAHYVRSEFNSVAVVPVSPQERSRACDTGTGNSKPGNAASSSAVSEPSKSAGARSPVRDRLPEPTSEFKLLDDEPHTAMPRAPEQQALAAKRTAASPVKRTGRASAGRIRARDKRSPQTLEETLEILGADELEIDDKRRSSAASSSGMQPKAPVRRSSPFTKLLDRLAERSRRDR